MPQQVSIGKSLLGELETTAGTEDSVDRNRLGVSGLIETTGYQFEISDARLFQQKAILWIAMWHDVFPEFDSVSEKRTVPISLSTFELIKTSSEPCTNDSN